MRNEMIFEDIQKRQNILLFTFLIWHISGVTKGLIQGGERRQKGPTGHCAGSTSQHSEKNFKSDGDSGCGWLT